MLKRINWNSIALRYLFIVGSVLIVGQLVFALFVVYSNFKQQRGDLHQKALTQVNFLSAVSPDNVLANNFYPLETLMRQTGEDPDYVYSVILHVDGRNLTNYLNDDDPFIQEALAHAEASDILSMISYLSMTDNLVEVSSPIVSEGLLIGEVRLGYTTEYLNGRLKDTITNTLASSSLLAVVLVLLTMVQFSRQIQRPIRELHLVANQFAMGDFSARAPVSGRTELNDLQLTFNSMAHQLQNNLVELEKLSQVASRTNNLVIICNPQGEVEWVNEAFVNLTEFTLSELKGKKPGRFLQGKDTNPETIAYMRQSLIDGVGFNCEILNYSKTKRPYWVDIEAKPVHDEQGTLINFIAIETDITERRRNEQLLKDSEALKSGILTTALDAIISINHEGEIIEFNPAAEAIFGHKKEAVLGRKMVEIIVPEQMREAHVSGFNRYLEINDAKVIGRRVELPALRADGSEFPAEVAITSIDHENKPIFTAHLRDISEKKHAELRLTEYAEEMANANMELSTQQYRLRSLLDIATSSTSNTETQFALVLEKSAKTLDMDVAILSRVEDDVFTITEIFCKDAPIENGLTCDLSDTFCHRTIQNGSVYSTVDIDSERFKMPKWLDRYKLKGYIGTAVNVNGNVYGTLSFMTTRNRLPFTESESDFIDLLSQWLSITLERQQSRLRLEAYAKELERSNKELEDFAYVASHDLQEPLRKIQSFGSRLESKFSDDLDERGLDYLNRMQNAAGRMQILIRELLSYSRITTTAKPFEQTDLHKIATNVLSDLEVRIEQSNAIVDLAPLISIEADRMQMRQLFQNIIGNALKFTSPERQPHITILGEIMQDQNEKTVYDIKISDNGIGFDEKYTSKIFGIFQRLHGKNQYEGTGVGLAICRKIVQRHAGQILVKSQPNVGTTFIIRLPIVQKQRHREF